MILILTQIMSIIIIISFYFGTHLNIIKSLLPAIIVVCSKQYNDFQNLIQYKNR